jgi:chaperone required for assembly of F1-ATPase
MLKPGAKRFYKTVEVRHEPAGFAVLLDGKPIKTPASRAFIAPTRALADAIAEEWRAQETDIAPDAMPLTRSLNTAIDRIAAHRREIVDDLANYAGSDLVCYRAAAPDELARRQRAAWDPWLEWLAERFGARLLTATGVTYVEQPAEALARVKSAIAAHDDHRLVALHAGVTITGSAVLGLAFAAKAISADETFAAAHVDEDYQAELWGRDAEAEHARARRRDDLRAARRFIDLIAA